MENSERQNCYVTKHEVLHNNEPEQTDTPTPDSYSIYECDEF